ncbi:hypothetical protein [Streptomyces sp. CO7]
MDDSLSFASFLKGAQRAAHKAMKNHAEGDYDDFALFGGVAVERLAKAVLVCKNPVYLLDTKQVNADLLMYFGGHMEKPKKVFTVGAAEAIKRLRRLQVLGSSEKLDELIELRNGTAHASVGDEAKSLLPFMAEALSTLLDHLGESVERFWGDWHETVKVAVDKRRSETQRDVEIRVNQARQLLEGRFQGLPPFARSKVKALGSGSSFVFFFHTPDGSVMPPGVVTLVGTTGCPACQGSAKVMISSDPTAIPTTAALTLESFRCLWCNLRLTGREEIGASGLDPEELLLLADLALGASENPPIEAVNPDRNE